MNPPNVNDDYEAAKAWMVDWFTRDAWRIRHPRELVKETCDRLSAAGVPLKVFNAYIIVLHPNYFGVAHRWDSQSGEVVTRQGAHELWNTAIVQDSPMAVIREGAAAIRRRLEDPGCPLEYPVLGEYKEAGATDYVMMRLEFSDESVHCISFTTERPGGFTEAELRLVDELLFYMGRLTEIQADRYLSLTLLNTYVGPRTGRKILQGTIQRGSGETIYAVIWLTDLRDFTGISNRLPLEELLELLNAYFDIIGEAVAGAGGEILKFIGDSALAIQPLDDPKDAPAACRAALEAAAGMRKKLAEVNGARAADGKAEFDFGLALHIGDVMYGNIGAEDRLDFTVIGPSVNEAARLESFCSALGEPLLLSKKFVEASKIQASSLGSHEAKGLDRPIEVFRPGAQ